MDEEIRWLEAFHLASWLVSSPLALTTIGKSQQPTIWTEFIDCVIHIAVSEDLRAQQKYLLNHIINTVRKSDNSDQAHGK